MRERKYWPFYGAVAGVLVGAGDWAFFHLMSLEMEVAGQDVTALVMLFFTVTYAFFGWVIGQLWAARARISEQYEALQAAQAREVQLESLASIGRLAAGVAHEVRNPLAVIRSSTGLLMETAEDPEAETAGRFIQEEVDRLDSFIGALLDFSRPVAVDRSPTSTARIAEHTARLAQAHVRWAAGDHTFDADTDQVVQLLNTLVVNAQAAAEQVAVEARRDGDHVVFDVRDDGPGVEPEAAPNIFQPFFTTKAKGTGLGLPMARRIAEAHGGALEYVSGYGLGQGGAGACFRVRLPR